MNYSITLNKMLVLATVGLCLQTTYVNAQNTTIGGGTVPVTNDAGYTSDYSPGGLYILSDGTVTNQNNSTWEHGNTSMDNLGTYNSTTGSIDLFVATGGNTISGTNAPNFYTANFDIGSNIMAVTNNNGINIANTLAFNNSITTTIRANSSTGAVHFADDATYSNSAIGDAQYVNGYVSKTGNDAFTFPVGNQTGNDLRTISITAPATVTDQLSIAYWSGDVGTVIDPTGGAHPRTSLAAGLSSVSPIGFWDWIPVSGTSATTVTVNLPAQAGLGSYTLAADIRLVGWNTTTNVWEILGAGGASGLGEGATLSGIVGNLSNYSALGWGSVTQTPLPIKLISFNGKVINCNSELNWKTATEQGSDHYEIEHSIDGKNFKLAGAIKSKNSPSGADYAFTYTDMSLGIHYFRLKIIDITSSCTYSNIISLHTDCGGSKVTVWPNPVTSVVKVSGLNGNTKAVILNVVGQLIRTLNTDASSMSIDMSAYVSGTYIIRIVNGDSQLSSFKILKK